jgi:hypothetical protein
MKKCSFVLSFLAVFAYAGAVRAADVDYKKHPHLEHAHKALENAEKQLKMAKNPKDPSDPFGGHRDKAEELVHQAQQEIQAAAEFANSH